MDRLASDFPKAGIEFTRLVRTASARMIKLRKLDNALNEAETVLRDADGFDV
jgi:hypothetical protein